MTQGDLLDNVLHGLFPMYSLQSPDQQRDFRQYCAQNIPRSDNEVGDTIEDQVSALLSFFNINLLVVNENDSSVLHTRVHPQSTVAKGIMPPACKPFPVPQYDKKTDSTGKHKMQSDIMRLDRMFVREHDRIERKRRLNQFLRTGVRADVNRSAVSDNIGTFQCILDLRNETTGVKWSNLSAWHRRKAFEDFLDRNEEIPLLRKALQSEDPNCILVLPEPEYDHSTGMITSLSKSDKKPKRLPQRKKTTRAAKAKKGILSQCRKVRENNMAILARSVAFTGNYVA